MHGTWKKNEDEDNSMSLLMTKQTDVRDCTARPMLVKTGVTEGLQPLQIFG